jgi:hypothetical protein
VVKKEKASRLYKQGRFNVANITGEADGSTTYVCDGRRGEGSYTFRARNFLTKDEELLDDPDVDVADEPAAHP